MPSLLTLSLAAILLGQSPADPSEVEAQRRELLQFFKSQAADLALFQGKDAKQPQPLMAEPILRYNNSERVIGSLDGATFLWLDESRPIAAVSLCVRKLGNNVYRECTSLGEAPLECRTKETVVWWPKEGGRLARPLAGAPAPAATKPQRLVQMRTLARRFSAACHDSGSDEATELRLLPQPLYRFAHEAGGILDGALFAFVVSNDPELFLLLEAETPTTGSDAQWRYSLARMSSLKETVRLDDKEIWSVPNFYREGSRDRKSEPYVEARIGAYSPPAASEK